MLNLLYLFVIPVLITLYLELVGRWITYKVCKKKLHFYFPIGFIFLEAIFYLTSPLTNLGVSFNLLLVIFILVICFLSFLIIKDFNKIDRKFNLFDVLIMIIVCCVLTYFSYNTTLGNLDGFDSTFYLNMVSQNIGLERINTRNYLYNNYEITRFSYYSSETFYYYAAVLVFLIGKIFSYFNLNFYYPIAFIWIYQILLNLTIGSVIVELYYIVKNKVSFLVCLFPFVFVFGKLYFHNALGFIGNSWIGIILSYFSLFLIEYLKENSINNRIMIYVILLGLCGLASSGIFIIIAALCGLFFFAYKDEHLLREYSIVLLLPLYNALYMEVPESLMCFYIPLPILMFIYIFGDYIQIIFKKKNIIIYFLILCIIITFSLSRFFSNSLFDFSGFFNNISQKADMSLNYFNIKYDNSPVIIYKIYILAILLLSFLLVLKNKIAKYFLILFLVFFNPLCCNFFNHYISVYYRGYSLVINPLAITILFDDLISFIYSKKIQLAICICIISIFIFFGDILNPLIYHYEFIPNTGYNHLYKMNNDEIDIINEIKNNIFYFHDENPYIVTNNVLTLSMLPQGRYIYCREHVKNIHWSKSEKNIYEIFYEPKYPGDKIVNDPDYDNMYKYIVDADIRYIVVKKSIEIYDEQNDQYTYLYLKANDECDCYPIYENDSYVLYRFS